MAVTTIPWNDGSGDNIYLSAASQVGDETVQVSSDANTGAARTQTVTFTSGVGGITRSLTVNQDAGVQSPLVRNLYSYIPKATDGAWYLLENPSNAYTDETSTNYSMIHLTRGSGAETYIYWLFDTSALPANATIVSVECKAKVFVSNGTSTNIATRQVQMFSGTTAMGTSQNCTTTAGVKTFSGVTWTREQLNDVRLRFYGVRGTKNTNADYYFRLYGATLTIEFTV